MSLELLKRAYERQRQASDSPVFNGPLDLVRDLTSDVLDLANLSGDPLVLRLVLAMSTANASLKGAMERAMSEGFLRAVGEQREASEPTAQTLLGGLVTVEFMGLLTPSSGQVRLGEATKKFAPELGDEARLVRVAVAIVGNVANTVFATYRGKVQSFLDASLKHCDGTTLSDIVPNLEQELQKVATGWHAEASYYRFDSR